VIQPERWEHEFSRRAAFYEIVTEPGFPAGTDISAMPEALAA